MIKRLTVDRIEEGTAVLLDENENEYRAVLLCAEGDILECEVDEDGNVSAVCSLTSETEERKEKNTSRLNALFGRRREVK